MRFPIRLFISRMTTGCSHMANLHMQTNCKCNLFAYEDLVDAEITFDFLKIFLKNFF